MSNRFNSKYLELEQIEVPQCSGVNFELNIPASKSITNRALIIALLAKGKSKISNLLDSEDSRVMINFIKDIKLDFDLMSDDISINGLNGKLPAHSERIYVENAGTAARFLSVVLLLGVGKYLIYGNERMHQRPIADLIDALKLWNIDIKSVNNNGCLPLEISATGLPGGEIEIKADKSSQYVSALLLAAPYAKKPVKIKIKGQLVSKPYIDMTIKLMQKFGAEINIDAGGIYIDNKGYKAADFAIEADYSSASYFLAIPAICSGQITIKNLAKQSLQGDSQIIEILKAFGCNIAWHDEKIIVSSNGDIKGLGEIDMFHVSDLVPTVAVLAAIAKGQTIIKNVENIRIKESDRISALVKNLLKIGVKVQELKDGLVINGLEKIEAKKNILIETFSDHRLAMAFSILSLKIPGLIIENPGCVAKTFPNFFDNIFKLNI